MDERSGCAEIRELLPDVASGLAADDESARVYTHLDACPDCRRELAALSQVADELLTLMPAVPPPAGFEAALMRRVVPSPRRRWRWGRTLRVALTVLLAAFAGSGVTTTSTAEEPRAPLTAGFR